MPKPPVLHRLLDDLARRRADHRERHRPSGFGLVLADRIDYLDGGHWDAVVQGRTFFLSRDYLRALEQAGPANLTCRYALAFRGTRPVVAMVVQVVDLVGGRMVKTAGAPVGPAPASRLARLRSMLGGAAQAVGKRAVRSVRLRVFACGNLLSWGPHGVAFAEDEDPAALWPAVADALYRLRQAERLSGKADLVLIKDLPAALTAGAESLARFRYRPLQTEPDMVLAIAPGWRSFADYAQSLAAKYRKTVRQIESAVVEAGLTVQRLADLGAHAGRLHALYAQVHERAAARPVTLPPDFLPAFAAAAGERLRCTVVRRGPQIVGFVTSLKDGATCIGYFIGFDTVTNVEVPLYFRLLQVTIGDAIELACQRLSLGRTALEPKARLGARPEPLWVWLRHRSPVLSSVLGPLLRAVPHAEPPERSPFKS